MGGSASVAHLPHEILNETEATNCLGLTQSQLSQLEQSSEVLANVRRKSSSELSGTVADRGKRSTAPINRRTPVRYELPEHVKTLLSKIGVESSSSGQTESSKQLVLHIFQCLEGLQHLVKFDQALLPMVAEEEEEDEHHQTERDTSSTRGETQSVAEANRESVGRLLHEMITIYTLCGDTVRVLLQASPEAARVEDSYGRLPLHVAVDRDQPWIDAIQRLVSAYPQALNSRDGIGRLPLHIAVDRQQPHPDVVRLLLRYHPQSAMARRGVGRLPIHYAIFADKPCIDVVQALLQSCPECAQTVDVYGRLPLHYAVDKAAAPDLNIVRCLLETYPEGAAIRDSHQRLPLTVALERENVHFELVKTLYEAYPQALSEMGNGKRLPLQILIDTNCNNLLVVDFIARKYPSALFQSTKPALPTAEVAAETAATAAAPITTAQPQLPAVPPMAPAAPAAMTIATAANATAPPSQQEVQSRLKYSKESPLALALDRNFPPLCRCLLLISPEYDPEKLRSLHWEARKIAFLLAHITNTSSVLHPCEDEDEDEESHRHRRPSVLARLLALRALSSSPSQTSSRKEDEEGEVGTGGAGAGGAGGRSSSICSSVRSHNSDHNNNCSNNNGGSPSRSRTGSTYSARSRSHSSALLNHIVHVPSVEGAISGTLSLLTAAATTIQPRSSNSRNHRRHSKNPNNNTNAGAGAGAGAVGGHSGSRETTANGDEERQQKIGLELQQVDDTEITAGMWGSDGESDDESEVHNIYGVSPSDKYDSTTANDPTSSDDNIRAILKSPGAVGRILQDNNNNGVLNDDKAPFNFYHILYRTNMDIFRIAVQYL